MTVDPNTLPEYTMEDLGLCIPAREPLTLLPEGVQPPNPCREIAFRMFETPAPIESRVIDGKEKLVSVMPDGSLWIVSHGPDAVKKLEFHE